METKPPEKKGLLTKLKENVDDHEEQMAVLGAAVRLGVVIWSGFIITLSYVELPMVKKSATAGDITFVASIFTGALATFGLSTGRTKGEKDKQHIAVIGDGSLAEGLALEALNHISQEKDIKMIIILNDNSYEISPGFGAIHNHLKQISNENNISF